jgi:hypothetical protein
MASPIPLAYPDERLRPKVVSLNELNDKYADLIWCEDDDIPAFVRLALSGRLARGDHSPHRDRKYVINVRRDAFVPSSGFQYNSRADYDSAVGQTRDCPYTHPMAVYPIPPFRDTLTKNNHCRGSAYDSNVS